jgi:SAM-dependent methyltransferase
MATPGELLYYDKIGEAGIQFAVNKPFSDPECDLLLMQVAAVMALLPPAPARILDAGCGTGWLSRMFARRGYACTGIDVCPRAVELAEQQPPIPGTAPRFLVQSVETMPFCEAFDAVVFFDALHHSIDESEAIRGAFRALRPGGICITSEPGLGHAEISKHVVQQYGVTEKSMPASHIIRLGLAAGFQQAETYPRMEALGRFFYKKQPARRWWQKVVRQVWLLNLLNSVVATLWTRHQLDNAMVVLHKRPA